MSIQINKKALADFIISHEPEQPTWCLYDAGFRCNYPIDYCNSCPYHPGTYDPYDYGYTSICRII